jgi:hypothetical protein
MVVTLTGEKRYHEAGINARLAAVVEMRRKCVRAVIAQMTPKNEHIGHLPGC